MALRILLVAAAFILFYSFRLNFPPLAYFDEVHYIPTARHIVHLSGFMESAEPPLGKLLIALSMLVFGDHPWVWRLPSLVLAGFATSLSAYLAFMLTGRMRLFWLVSFLLFCDGLWITQARIAMLNAPMIFFIVASLVFWWHGHADPLNRRRFWIGAGACAGFAMGCKWQGALVALIPLAFYLLASGSLSEVRRRFWIYGLLSMTAAYFMTFLIILFMHGWQWSEIWTMQGRIPYHHLHLQGATHPYASRWYTWPFLIRPISLGFSFVNYDPNMPLQYQIVNTIVCIGNPFIFMLIVPALIWGWVCIRHKKDPLSIIALSGFFIFWLPSGMLQRYTMFQHFYPVMPFMVMAIAAMLDSMWRSSKDFLNILTAFVLILIILGYAFFFPLWTGLPITYTYFLQHCWLPSWQ